jgi:hypothetical protein
MAAASRPVVMAASHACAYAFGEKAADPLHRAGIDAEALGNAPHDRRPVAVGTSYSTYTLRCSGGSVGVTMTAGHFNDPEHWRQQADEARAIARQLPNPESKAVMMRIGADYDRAGAG